MATENSSWSDQAVLIIMAINKVKITDIILIIKDAVKVNQDIMELTTITKLIIDILNQVIIQELVTIITNTTVVIKLNIIIGSIIVSFVEGGSDYFDIINYKVNNQDSKHMNLFIRNVKYFKAVIGKELLNCNQE